MKSGKKIAKIKEAELSINYQAVYKLLLDKNKLLDSIMETMGDGLSIQDLDMRIVYQNKFMIDNFGDHAGEYCYSVYENRDKACEGCPIQMAYKDGKVHQALRIGITRNGVPFRFENIASVLKDKHNNIVAGMELCRIVEEREKVKEMLQKSENELQKLNTDLENKVAERTTELADINSELQKVIASKQTVIEKEKELNMHKSYFISVISHEFRTPLSGIKSSIDLFERYEQNWDSEKKKQLYNSIHSGINYIKFLLDDVTLAGEAFQNELSFIPQQVNIAIFLKEILSETNNLFELKSNIKFKSDIKTNELLIDSNLLHRVLYNLLSNAVKFSNNTEDVIFDVTELPEKKLKFIITDKGIGIPDNDKKNIFEPFYRAKNAETIRGLGIGLSIVKQCVNLHNGSIDVVSKENFGTTVTLIIPFDTHVI